jgi:undecaprenyl-phosphate galactose phosphotransferase
MLLGNSDDIPWSAQTPPGAEPVGNPASSTNIITEPKRIIDVVLSALILIVAAPAMIFTWVLVRLDGGPAIYSHVRVGQHGREFRCHKFRTMVVDSDAVLARHLAENAAARSEWAASRKLKDDPRVTRLGRFLRKTSLDEMPQLLNVLRGEMSLVGPRPIIRAELETHYGVEGASAYMSVRPGLTGLWQVSGRSDVDYRKRVALDTDYVRNASLARDMMILCQTVKVVLLQKGAR